MENIVKVSNKIWDAIQNGKIDVLLEFVHPEAVFVHMGVTLSREDEIDVIKSKKIVYKEIDFQEKTVHQMESTVILLNKLELTAIVDGNEVINPFVVTEVYTKNDETLKMASLSFTKITY